MFVFAIVIIIVMIVKILHQRLEIKGLNLTIDSYEERRIVLEKIVLRFYAPDSTPTIFNNYNGSMSEETDWNKIKNNP